jgi:hypothetical protein
MLIHHQTLPHSVEKLNPKLTFQIGQGSAHRGTAIKPVICEACVVDPLFSTSAKTSS